jgi:thiol:disulfide interchange protein DsbD
MLYGSAIFVGMLAGADSILDPLHPFRYTQQVHPAAPSAEKDAENFTLDQLQKTIAASHKPVIVDISRKNCAACSELDHITFRNSQVTEEMKRFRFIRIDITGNSPDNEEIMKHYGVFGAPNLLFFDSSGKPLRDKFLTGFIPPEKFLKHIGDIR